MADRRAVLERGWILASVLYGGLRTALVWAFLREYGVNTWVFAAVEVASSLAYGISSARVVGAVVDARYGLLRTWAPLALVAYFAPDAYVFSSAGRMPDNVLTVVIGVFVVALVVTAIGMIAQLRRGRRSI